MIIDCQLKSLLENYLNTLIVGFGQADALGFSHKKWQEQLVLQKSNEKVELKVAAR